MWGSENDKEKPQWPNDYFKCWDGKLCCTGWHYGQLGKAKGFDEMFMFDMFPFVNSARDGGFNPSDSEHVQVTETGIDFLLALGVHTFRISSATAYRQIYAILGGKTQTSYNAPIEVKGQLLHVRIFTNIPNGKGGLTAAVCFGSDHLSMARFPNVGNTLRHLELAFRDFIRKSFTKAEYLHWKELMPGKHMTEQEQEESMLLFLSDRDADGTRDEYERFCAEKTSKKHTQPGKVRNTFCLMDRIYMWYSHKGGESV